MFDSVFGRSFSSAKCKTLLRLAISRIKLLRNKREIQLKQMRKELAQLLQSNQEPSARIRVEHIYREQNIMAAYEVIELFCELMVVRLPIIDSQRLCPIDLREAVASLIFAAPRCSDVPELLQVRNLLSSKYGKEFVVAAAELRPDCGVNRLVIEKLSVRAPSGDVKLKLMKDIAVEQNVDWDPTDTESELLKAPEDLLEGPTRFLGASQMSLERPPDDPSTTKPLAEENQESELQNSKGTAFQSFKVSSDEKQYVPFVVPSVEDQTRFSRQQSTAQSVPSQVECDSQTESPPTSPPSSLRKHVSLGSSDHGEEAVEFVNNRDQNFKDVVLAARTAAEAAERAAAAARAAAALASEKFDSYAAESSTDSDDDGDNNIVDLASQLEAGSPEKHMKSQLEPGSPEEHIKSQNDNSFYHHSGSGRPLFEEPEEGEASENANPFATRTTPHEDFSEDIPSGGRVGTFDEGNDGLASGQSFSQSWNTNNTSTETLRGTSVEPGPYFDTDVADAETESLTPKFAASHVHPKLPDYDDLSARFESLRSNRH